MFTGNSQHFAERAFRGSSGAVSIFIASAFLDSQWGKVQHIKYPVMLLAGGASIAWLLFACFFNRGNGALGSTARCLLWGVAFGLLFVALLHMPFILPQSIRELSEATAKTPIDYAVGVVTLMGTLGAGLLCWRASAEES
jgi:ABC-type Fe3+-siderophore transport system permease subunit